MLEQLLHHIKYNQLCEQSDRLLLAVSGGIDSMVMVDMFRRAGFSVGIAHCNFQLRGEESDLDEQFVRDFCLSASIPFHSRKFDTVSFAGENNLSIQVAARSLRYSFFEEIIQQSRYRYVATAHNHNDNLETVLLHLIRGTGIDGLAGIPVRNGHVIRPILFATRDKIIGYAEANKVEWRNDSSNLKDDYHRNFLRNNVISLLEKINPNLKESFKDTLERIQGTKAYVGLLVDSVREKYFVEKNDQVWIVKHLIGDYPFPAVLLWEAIKPYGFRFDQCKQIIGDHQTGKKFLSDRYQLTVDREHFIITQQKDESLLKSYTIHSGETSVEMGRFRLDLFKAGIDDFVLTHDPSHAQLDFDKIDFPLTWRLWHKGDSFQPLGMQHKKKISDFLIDQKIPLPQKDDVTVVEAGENIVWVVGHRIDERYKVSSQTRRVLVIRLSTS